ncbi:MAG: pilin [Candidatus Roizmanbacteria bacterium]|nr:pilin [Candidatus Roizmanbacteria bacterium]
MSVFALGVQPNDLTQNEVDFCNNAIEDVSLTFGRGDIRELSLSTQLYRETLSREVYYLDSTGNRVNLPLDRLRYASGIGDFNSFRIKFKQGYLQNLFEPGITNAKLLVDFPGRNIITGIGGLRFPDSQEFLQVTSDSSKLFESGNSVYDFTDLRALFNNNPVKMLDVGGEIQGGWRNDFYQIFLSYDYSQSRHELSCPIRFAVAVPPPEQYCSVTLTKNTGETVASLQQASGAQEYVFPVNDTNVYTLTFSDIDINSLTSQGGNTLFLNIGSQNLMRMSCGITNHIKPECRTFTFLFGPGHHQFIPTNEGKEYLLTFTDTAGLPKCRDVRIIAGHDDIESQHQSTPTGEPSRDLSEDDLNLYNNLAKKQTQATVANTVDLCETVSPNADCGGGRGSCVQKCLSCTISITTAEQNELNQLITQADESGNLSDTQLSRMQVLQDKSNGLSSTHIWTGLGCIPTDISGLINSVFTTLVGVLGGFILLCIIFEGMRIMTSAGNPEALKKAQEGITSCIIGFIVVFFSVLILRIIGVDILQLPWFGK